MDYEKIFGNYTKRTGFIEVSIAIPLIIIDFLFLHNIINISILSPIIFTLYMILEIITIYLIISKYKVMSTNYVIAMFTVPFGFFNITLTNVLSAIKPVNVSLLTWLLSNFSFILVYVLSIKIIYMKYKPVRIILKKYDGKYKRAGYIALAIIAALLSLLSTHAI
ncbi:hypothetical protein D1867_11105 [Acidianus infernus]|uniref:Uncharacterized protein n=1 Tax=Acidianus infernus TaxID=12915 RepID=A0A6A9QHI0_ACIIN|nr:hypothetical protein [Acidianus infernus]MUM65775.1 hypothetical protein [Acidianus infernus]